MSDAYKNAGVDIEAGNRLVKAIGPLAAATHRKGADTALGGFGGLFDLKAAGYNDPLLVSGTDGVGTKLMLAFATGRHDTIGIDLVAMCANDILAQGAEPLFFLDYFACGKLEQNVASDVIAGIAEGCRRSGAALIGGETAEMPGMYPPGHYDLAGFCVGAVDRDKVLPKVDRMASGDLIIGLPSSGAHSNGYSLIRKIVDDAGLDWSDKSPFSDAPLAEDFLEPTRLYIDELLPPCKTGAIKGLAHITGGGLTENVPRALPSHLDVKYDHEALTLPAMFEWLKEQGKLSQEDVLKTFNCGIGMVVIADPKSAIELLSQQSDARIIGELIAKP